MLFRSVGGDGAFVGLVVVLAGEAFEVDGEGLEGGGVDLKVVPVGLAVAFVLVDVAGEVGAVVGGGEGLDAAEAATGEVPGDGG